MSNAMGQVVGTSEAFCNTPGIHPFLWENGGPMVDLNTLIPADSGAPLYEASNINDRGEIVAGGLPAGCNNPFSCGHVYLLIPCDADHPSVEGCDYNAVGDTSDAEIQARQSTQLSVEAAKKWVTPETAARYRRLRKSTTSEPK
jgi:probable HAF family extracellular repeat protein